MSNQFQLTLIHTPNTNPLTRQAVTFFQDFLSRKHIYAVINTTKSVNYFART